MQTFDDLWRGFWKYCGKEKVLVPLFSLVTTILSTFLKTNCNAHIWYAGSFQQYPTSEGHIIKVKVEYQGYISQKMAISGALVFHEYIFFFFHETLTRKPRNLTSREN